MLEQLQSYTVMGFILIIITIISWWVVMIVLTCISFFGNEICKFFGLADVSDVFLTIKARNIVAFVLAFSAVYFVLTIIGKLVSLFI